MKKLLPLLLISSLYGHDLYLMPQKFRVNAGDRILLSAHTGDSFPLSEQPVDPKRLTSLPAMSLEEWRMLGKATHATVTVAEGSHYYAIHTSPKFLELEAPKFASYLKEEGLTAALAAVAGVETKSREMYSKYAKTYVIAGKPSGNFAKPLGLKIEIVPLADPALLTEGGSLPIQVLYEGKPLADVQVELASSRDPRTKTQMAIAGRSDANGKLTVKIPNAGKVRLHAVTMNRVKQPSHDWESFWASLTFEVASRAPTESSTLTSR